MARPKTVRAPTKASLPNSLLIPSTSPSLSKTLGKLSRQSLLELALSWLDDQSNTRIPPFLQGDERKSRDDDDDALPYPAAETEEEVRQIYEDLQERKGGKREVLERILEGDWRHGITLRQLAMVDLRYMDDHPASLRWTALELSRIDSKQKAGQKPTTSDWSASLPRIQAASFVKALQQEIASLVKAHFHIARSSTLPLTFLRIFVVDSPYQSPQQSPEVFADSSRTIYVAFPDSCPYIYTSVAASAGAKPTVQPSTSIATDSRSLQRLVRDAIPKALSRPHERYTLKATALAAKNLPTLLALRGPGRSTAANGSFSIFADAALEGSPLDPRPANTVSAQEHMHGGQKRSLNGEDKENGDSGDITPALKKRKLAVESRFGTAGSGLTPAPLDRFDARLLDPLGPGLEDDDEQDSSDHPVVSLSFTGSDVISGIRQLAELGIVDPQRMPSWMTGEESVSMVTVKAGRRV